MNYSTPLGFYSLERPRLTGIGIPIINLRRSEDHLSFITLLCEIQYTPVRLFTKKMPSYGDRNPHHKPKTVWRPSEVYNGNPYTNKTASRLFAYPFVQAHIKENIKAPRHWPLWGEFTGHRWIPLTEASNAENVPIWWRHHVEDQGLCTRLVRCCVLLWFATSQFYP